MSDLPADETNHGPPEPQTPTPIRTPTQTTPTTSENSPTPFSQSHKSIASISIPSQPAPKVLVSPPSPEYRQATIPDIINTPLSQALKDIIAVTNVTCPDELNRNPSGDPMGGISDSSQDESDSSFSHASRKPIENSIFSEGYWDEMEDDCRS